MTDSLNPEFVFPPAAIPTLQGMRGPEWDRLIEATLTSRSDSPERAAFVLMMVRLAGCITCQADSFRALRGCVPCSRQVIRRFASEDGDLYRQYISALEQVEKYCSSLED